MELNKIEQDFIIKQFKREFNKDVCIASGNCFKDGKEVNLIWIF